MRFEMNTMNTEHNLSFNEAVRGLLAGDFSRLSPLFESLPDGSPCLIIQWYESGLFATQPKALGEAFTCACFLGQTAIVEYLLDKGVDPSGGAATGLNAFHWAANRGQLEIVEILIRSKAPLETQNAYGGTVLGSTVFAATNEPRADHVRIIEALAQAGAQVGAVAYPTGNEQVDAVLRSHGATA
jgi:hypothetical protein